MKPTTVHGMRRRIKFCPNCIAALDKLDTNKLHTVFLYMIFRHKFLMPFQIVQFSSDKSHFQTIRQIFGLVLSMKEVPRKQNLAPIL